MANTEQNIAKFYQQAQGRDFSRDFLFRVTDIVIPGLDFEPADLVYAKTAALPNRQITNVTAPYMGLAFNIPGNATYPGSDAYSITFYLDASSKLRNNFEFASRDVFDEVSSTGIYQTPDTDAYIELSQLDKDLNPINTYKLIGASIRNIDNVGYTMAEGTGATVELTVTLSYHYYTQTLVSAGTITA